MAYVDNSCVFLCFGIKGFCGITECCRGFVDIIIGSSKSCSQLHQIGAQYGLKDTEASQQYMKILQ